jgi:nicotinamide-nucleotide amidase
MKAELISVGTELLLGDIVNTNAQYLSRRLADLGISVYRQMTVGDNRVRFSEAIRSALDSSDIIIVTGGLGPTEDDLTKETVFEYFGMMPVLHEPSMKRIDHFFSTIGRQMSPSNQKQALFPAEAIVLDNDHGTAPGCIVGKDGKFAILLPGPPREMKPMFEDKALPWLMDRSDSVFVSRTVNFAGIGESAMEEKVRDLVNNENPTVAPYAKDSYCQLRITARAADSSSAFSLIDPVLDDIRSRFGDDIFGYGDTTLEAELAKLLFEKGITIAAAESCTGGIISARLVSVSGISSLFIEGAVCYANDAKVRRLGVKQETLDRFGAVSEETALEMAEGICRGSGSALGISTTGIAGPDGGTDEKPVGLVYIGISLNGRTTVTKHRFAGDRVRIRERAAATALDLARRAVLSLV